MTDFQPTESKPASSKLPLSIMDGSAESPDQLALEDGINDAPVTEGKAASEPEKLPPRRSSADIEEAAFQCLVDKKNTKKEKAKNENAKKTKNPKNDVKELKKRPAAAPEPAAPLKKRPAAASAGPQVMAQYRCTAPPYNYVLERDFGTRDRRTFQSLHFHRLKNKLGKDHSHLDAEVVKGLCADVLSRAGKLWDDHHGK